MSRNKVWHAGRAPQEELDAIDRCNDCERYKDLFPNLAETCRAREYCHRQMKMQIEEATEGRNHEQERAGNAVR